MKSHELKKLSSGDVKNKLEDLRTQLMKLRIKQKTKMAMQNTKEIRTIRRTIAQLLSLKSNNKKIKGDK